MGLVLQAQTQLVATLFGDRRIFVNAPQYHGDSKGAIGANDETKQQLIALDNQLYNFDHHTKECEMELWHWLGHAMDFPRAQCLLVINQEELQ